MPADDGRGRRRHPMTCTDCGAQTIRRSPSQRYCPPCSAAHDGRRKREWAAAHERKVDPDAYPKQRSRIVAAGATRSQDNRASIFWPADEPIDPVRVLRAAVPFSYAFSKNAIWRRGKGGHVYLRREAAAARDALIWALRASGGHRGFVQGKVWIDVFVEKPDQRGDAINVIDLVCDAVKEAIDVDDRWFAIRRIDWSIVKDGGRLFVGVAQEGMEPQQACSHCGRLLPLAEFGRNRSTKTGRTRVCQDCSAPVRGRKARA